MYKRQAVVSAMSLWHVPESRNVNAREVDWFGAAIATLGLTGVVYGFLESATVGWRHPRILASLILGFVSLALFLLVEARVRAPMLPLELFKSWSLDVYKRQSQVLAVGPSTSVKSSSSNIACNPRFMSSAC